MVAADSVIVSLAADVGVLVALLSVMCVVRCFMSPKRHVEILNPSTSEWGRIWK